jgi:hypothetical protein
MILDQIFCLLRVISDAAKGFIFICKTFKIMYLQFNSGCPSRLAGLAGGAVFKLGSFGNFGVRRQDCALERRDMSRRGKAGHVAAVQTLATPSALNSKLSTISCLLFGIFITHDFNRG